MPHIRAMKAEDYAAAAAVLQRNGLAAMSREDYLHLWEVNSFQEPGAPRGWVLEESGRGVVGTFSNLHLPYEWNQTPIRVGTGFAWAVDPEYRRHAIGMLRRWTRQPNLDLLLTSTASERVGEILSALRFRPVPHPAYDQALYWVTNERGFAASALRQAGAPRPDWLSYPAAPLLRVLGWLRERRAPREERPDVLRLTDFDGRFDAFWMKLRQTPNRLLAVRSPDVLSWHFKRARDDGGMEVLSLEEPGGLTGYLVMIRQDHETIGLTRYRVADLQVLGDSQSRVRALVAGALRRAAEQGIHVVEVVGLSACKREALSALSPLRRKMPSWLFYYRAADQWLATALEADSAWDPSPFDGDASL
ncbi:MAG: hypothetical protein WCA32_12435 [Chromatiaceae bacterium]